MSRFVPYLAEKVIERNAAALLAEYEHERGLTITPPIPIEDIVEKHLKLGIEFDDTHARFGVPRTSGSNLDILGAIFGDGRIVIDESLDPEENPAKESRYRFTLAHESGHWQLHRQLIVPTTSQASVFDDAPDASFICRSNQAKKREEWQADFYASCLLMPRKMILASWNEMSSDEKQGILRLYTRISQASVENRLTSCGAKGGLDLNETDDEALKCFCRSFASRFQVSPIAMRIRLEKLGLLRCAVSHQQLLTSE
jgi:Zn-dependent peptidase ImmA (M78 family)